MIDTTIKINGETLRYVWISFIDIDDKRKSDWQHHEICSCCGAKIVHVVYINGQAKGRDCVERELGIDIKKKAKKSIDLAISALLKIELGKLCSILDIIGRHKKNIALYEKMGLAEEKAKSEEYLKKHKTKEIEQRRYIKSVFGYNV